MNKVLCVVDDNLTRGAVRKMLGSNNIEDQFCSSNEFVTSYLEDPEIVSVILDATSNTDRILEISRKISSASSLSTLAIIRLDQVLELGELMDAGTNDFVISPIRSEELILRLQVLMLRVKQHDAGSSEGKLGCGELLLDKQEHRVWKNKQPVSISPMGFALLAYFLSHQSQVVTKHQLMQDVWGYTTPNENANLVEIGIARLRRELGEDPKKPVYLHTIWGKGYRFEYHAPGG